MRITAILKTVEFKKPNRPRRPPAPVLQRSTPVLTVPARTIPSQKNEQPKAAPVLDSFIQKLPRTKKSVSFLAVGCLAIGLIIWGVVHSSNEAVKKPTYQTVLPKGKTIAELGGWKRVSPPNSEPVFAYTDAIDGVAVSVTEQSLPQSFKTDTDSQVAELAKKFNATDKVAAGATTIYIGTSAKGPQSVIFTTGSLLILIKSEKKVSDASWAKYAEVLAK